MLKKFITGSYNNTVWGYYAFNPLIAACKYCKFRLISDKDYIAGKFRNVFGRDLDWENPQTFNEKLNWLKLKDRTDRHTGLADKVKVREYVKNKIGDSYLIPLEFVTEDVRQVVPENLPDEPFILKTNHNSAGGIIVYDKNAADWQRIRFRLYRQLQRNYYHASREWQYKNIAPVILAEKLVMDGGSAVERDFRFHCFNEKVNFISVDIDKDTDHRRNLYDRDWNLMPCEWKYPNGVAIEKPYLLAAAINLAEKLASGFCYARVDFYLVGSAIYFGEITFHPGSGYGKFSPAEWDLKLGMQLSLDPVLD